MGHYFCLNDPEVACFLFLSMIMDVVNKHAPLRKTRIKQIDSPWMTSTILHLMRDRDRLKAKAKKTESDGVWEKIQVCT